MKVQTINNTVVYDKTEILDEKENLIHFFWKKNNETILNILAYNETSFDGGWYKIYQQQYEIKVDNFSTKPSIM